MSGKTARQIVEELKKQYKDDPEALEEIERREADIKYVEMLEKKVDYDGQPSIGIAYELQRTLSDWY